MNILIKGRTRYRVWNKNLKTYNENVLLNQKGEMLSGKCEEHYTLSTNVFTLQFGTGITDLFNREVFDGDLVYSGLDGFIGLVVKDGDVINEWSFGCFGTISSALDIATPIVIVGNINQHPLMTKLVGNSIAVRPSSELFKKMLELD